MSEHASNRGVRARAAPVAAAVAVLCGATLLHLARQRGVPVWNSLWAEDGRVFLSDAIRDFPGTLLDQNGGYIHVVPRLVGGVVAALPVADAAAGMAVVASAVIALIGGFVYVASAEVLRSKSTRLALAASVVLVPIPGSELLANATNLHFFMLFACFWALVWQSDTRFALSSRAIVALTTALSDPLSGLFLPLALVAPVVRRSRRGGVVTAVFVAGLVVQYAIISGGGPPERNWEFREVAVPVIFSLRVGGGLLVGDRFLGDAWSAFGHAFAFGALLVVAGVIASLMRRSTRRTVAFAVIALSYAGLFFAVQMFGRGTGGLDPDLHGFRLNGARYVLLPFLFTATAILALVDRAPRVRESARWKWGRRAALLWLAALLAANYSVVSDRSPGPRWDRELTKARASCSAANKRIGRVLVAPSPPRVWFATVPCGRL